MDKEAINEGLADIMGAMIEYSIEQNNDWYIMFNKHDTRIRNMKDPYPYPDTYRKDNWELPISNTYFDGIQHNNSTVFSHWFYLLVSGGSGVNDWGDSYNLSSINMDDMIKIVLHTFINGYYTSNGSYYDLAMGTIKAAYDLFGTNMAESIYHGWAAVGVYGGCKSNTTSFIINNAAIIDYGSIEEINYPITLPVTEVYGELIVKSILNIVGDNNSQSFKPQIQVYGGGKLTVDGGTITNDCIQNEVLENKVNGLFQNYYMEENIDLNWNGIIVLGTPNSNQFGSQQGKVIMNNAIIKNVDKTAVSLGENNFSGGGYIIATNSKFINCANAVKFYPYNNNIENGINYGNSSYFSNCEFIINKKLVDENQDYDPFILLYGNSGVNFKGCTFKNEIPNQFNNDKRGIGIYAFQSSFNVIPLNLTCSLSICKSKFENLHRGIMMEYYRGMSKPNKIKNNIFTNNVKGILARGGSSVITENIFNIPTTSLSSGEYSHGLYIEGYNGNVVQENTFSGNELSTNAAFGLVVNNTGSYNINEYYKNYFSGNLSVSNSYYNSTPHVQFKCNDYNSHPYINVQIESPYFDDQSFCQPDQQAVDYYTAPAGNIFHTTTNNNYPQILLSQNVIESEIKYAHHDAILYEPTTVTSFSSITSWLNNNCNVNAQDHCPTKLSIGQSFSGVLQDLHLKKQTVANYFDNGNTYTFVSNIKNSSYSTTNLYNDLKNYSNLSDEVLTHLISRSNKLNSLQLIDIYKKNAPHSNNVLVSLKYHYPTFYANYIDSINYYQTLTNSRKDSLSKYYYLNNNYQIIQNEYFSHLAEVDSSEQIKIILENDSTIESKLKLIPLLINEGELINASNLISNMPIFNKELYYFKDFYNFIINNTDSSNTLQIDSTDLSYLESIINTNAPIGTVAKNIKNQYFNILNSEYYNLPDLNNYKKENYNIQYLSTNMTIYPNPASDQIFIRINDINENGKIKIYNLQGKIISYLDLKEQVTTVNTSNWSQGIYILEYSINNNRLHKKISIIK